ncbi:MAG: hypothetical protein AMXMBFR61_15850 [Fimbriimonadales bacterium]
MTKRLTLAAVLLLWVVSAFCLPAYVKLFSDTYAIPKDSALAKAKCAVCHVGMTKKLNPYGQALDKLVKADKGKKLTADILKKLNDADSDGDGVKNLAEIKAGKMPGDPKSK